MHKRHNEATAKKYPGTTGATLHRATHYDIRARLMGLGVNGRINRMIVEMAKIKPGDKALDVGCGTGNLTLTAKEYAGATGSVYGIDASPEMLDVARRKAKTSGSMIVFDLGLIEKIPYSDATFDVVISNLVIHHLPDELKRQAFKEIYRVMKPGGTIFMTDFKPPTHSLLTHFFLTLLFHRRMMQSRFDMSAIPLMLAEAGFADIASGPTRSAFLAFVTGKKPTGLREVRIMGNNRSCEFTTRQQAVSHSPTYNEMSSSEIIIDMHQVSKTYNLSAQRFTALKMVDLEVKRGEFVAIVGNSGSGKTTLLNLLAGIDRPTSGAITVAGTRLDSLSESKLAKWRGRTIGLVFQFFQLLPTLTVAENVMLPMDFANIVPAAKRRSKALELLDRVDIADKAGKLPTTLSGGEQQRAAIARALANDPPVLLADEPTGNLDSATGESVIKLFTDLNAEGRTILVVTHERDIRRSVKRQVVLVDGRVADAIQAETEQLAPRK